MTHEELNRIIENHQHWLNRDCEGWENMKANLEHMDLSGFNLLSINLSHANLRWANLNRVNLSGANLNYVNLSGANLYGANLQGANLVGANLCDVILMDANLEYANLRSSILLQANLSGTDFVGANLGDAMLDENEKCRLGIILDEPIVGYKMSMEGKIIELEIPEGAIVFSINNGKCRANKAIIKKCDGIQHSMFDRNFEYKEGKKLKIGNFDLRSNIECSTGIHFFRTKNEAENYLL